MEMLRQEKIDMYEELKEVSLGHDFLEGSFDELRKVIDYHRHDAPTFAGIWNAL